MIVFGCLCVMSFLLVGGAMGSDSNIVKEGFDDGNNDRRFNHVLVPIPA